MHSFGALGRAFGKRHFALGQNACAFRLRRFALGQNALGQNACVRAWAWALVGRASRGESIRYALRKTRQLQLRTTILRFGSMVDVSKLRRARRNATRRRAPRARRCARAGARARRGCVRPWLGATPSPRVGRERAGERRGPSAARPARAGPGWAGLGGVGWGLGGRARRGRTHRWRAVRRLFFGCAGVAGRCAGWRQRGWGRGQRRQQLARRAGGGRQVA